MVAEQPVQRAARPHGDAGRPCIVVFYHRAGAARPFVIVTNIGGGHSSRRAFDPFSIPVINKAGGGPAAHTRQAVLGVIRQVISAAADGTRYLVAVAIVNIAVASGRRNGVGDGAVPGLGIDKEMHCSPARYYE